MKDMRQMWSNKTYRKAMLNISFQSCLILSNLQVVRFVQGGQLWRER